MCANSIKVVTANMEIVVDSYIMIKYVNLIPVKEKVVKKGIQDNVLITTEEATANSKITANIVTRKTITQLR